MKRTKGVSPISKLSLKRRCLSSRFLLRSVLALNIARPARTTSHGGRMARRERRPADVRLSAITADLSVQPERRYLFWNLIPAVGWSVGATISQQVYIYSCTDKDNA